MVGSAGVPEAGGGGAEEKQGEELLRNPKDKRISRKVKVNRNKYCHENK